MTIRKAQEKDISRIIELLGQVLQIHAEIRPDIFIPDTTKYTEQELATLLKDEKKPILSRFWAFPLFAEYSFFYELCLLSCNCYKYSYYLLFTTVCFSLQDTTPSPSYDFPY